jgi:hypothetical protein
MKNETVNNVDLSNDLKINLHKQVIALGFTDLSIVNVDCISVPQLQLETMPVEMINEYHEAKYYTHDITIKRAQQNNTSFYISELFTWIFSAPVEIEETKTMKGIYQLYNDYEFYDSFHIPFEVNGDQHLLTIVSHGISKFDFTKQIKKQERHLFLMMRAAKLKLSNEYSNLLPASK